MDRICVALDLEMTGSQVGVDEIIEVGAVKFRGPDVLETFSQLVKPRQSLPLKITRLTGITEDELAAAPRFNAVAPEFVSFVKNYPLVAHSIDNDLKFLNAQGMHFAQPAYDTFDMATLLLPHVPVYRLSALAEELGIQHPADHRALNDADVTRQVFLQLLARIDALALNDLAEMQRLMVKTEWSLRELFGELVRSRMSAAWQEAASGPPQSEPPLLMAAAPAGDAPLKPTGDTSPLERENIAAFFESSGPMSQHFTCYEQRPQQVEMAHAVTDAFNHSRMLLVEAGTGTGKSMAYLVPAALFALRRGERVVISTNTINLQDQLFTKDIPDVRHMLTAPQVRAYGKNGSSDNSSTPDISPDMPALQAALLKGRSNYLCLRRYKSLRLDENLTPHEAQALLKVHLWLQSTHSGDRAEILLMDREQATWGRINVTPDTCIGYHCPDFRECYFFQARRKAESAHVVVVNHALLLADLQTDSRVLPAYDHLVIDEAHNLEEVATEQLGFRIDQGALLTFLDSLYQTGGAQTVSGLLAEYQRHFQHSKASADQQAQAERIARQLFPIIERARAATSDFFSRLHAFLEQQGLPPSTYDPRLRLTSKLRQQPAWADVEQTWENLRLALDEIGGALGRFLALVLELEEASLTDYDDLRLRVESLAQYASEVRVCMGSIIAGDEDTICWLSLDQLRNILLLNSAPLSVAEILQSQLFAQKQTSVLTSATLSVSESFDFVRARLGLAQPEEVQLDSPFDYERQALVYIPDDIPEPNQRGYQQMLEDALIGLCRATEGRTLALFTASSTLRQTYAGIQDTLEEQGITVLAQGIDGSRRALLERFREWPRTVLLGTNSFWEGIDVVGDALSVLVITKLPFGVPSDPIIAARSEQFSDPFQEYSIPQSILRFKQGFGRLIRSKDDRGMVVVLDKRLVSKRYGQQFLQSLPATSVRTGALKHLSVLASRFIGSTTKTEQ